MNTPTTFRSAPTSFIVAALCGSALFAACGEEPERNDNNTDVSISDTNELPDDTGGDAGTDSETDDTTTPDVDVDTEPARPIGGERPQTPDFVARSFIFEGEQEGGVADGFNLDNSTTRPGDGTGCDQGDFVAADGTPGIDNQFALLLPLIAAAGGSALPVLVQSAINEGDLLILVRLEGLDDNVNDPNVSVTVERAKGAAIVGADSMLLPWQTFDVDTEEPSTTFTDGVLVDGVLNAGPASLDLPIFVFNFRFDVTLHGAVIRVTFDENGPVSAIIGGAVSMENILRIANNPGIQDRIPALIEDIGGRMADIRLGESCDALSVAVTIDLTPVHLYEE